MPLRSGGVPEESNLYWRGITITGLRFLCRQTLAAAGTPRSTPGYRGRGSEISTLSQEFRVRSERLGARSATTQDQRRAPRHCPKRRAPSPLYGLQGPWPAEFADSGLLETHPLRMCQD